MAQEPTREVLELLLASDPAPSAVGETAETVRIDGLLIGVLTQVDPNGEGRIAFDSLSVNAPLLARSVVPMTRQEVGRQVCLMFEKGDWTKPVVLGFLQAKVTQEPESDVGQSGDKTRPIEARIDGERIVLEGHKEIVLRCGKASITLTQDGRVLVRGTYLSSRSSGPNLIKGGSVQLN